MSPKLTYNRRRFLAASAMTIAALRLGMSGAVKAQSGSKPAPDPFSFKGELSSLRYANSWLNSQPLTSAGLTGKVVVINFWTYTCINWLRTLPYVRAWADKYKDQGLVVIGVHTPEFPFEHNTDNVRLMSKNMHVDYPIAIDNDYSIWRGFSNQYWPATYIIDTKGHIRHHQFGEGGYEQTEKIIRQLISETGTAASGPTLVSVEGQGAEAPADWNNLRSPENYLGYDRSQNFASPGGPVQGKHLLYTAPEQLDLNQWALVGDWAVKDQSIVLNKANGRIVYRWHARDLHLVMAPAKPGTSIRFRVLIDGEQPGAAHGVDVDEKGNGTLTEQRMYQLIRQSKPIVDRRFEIEFLDAGAEGFSFTFG